MTIKSTFLFGGEYMETIVQDGNIFFTDARTGMFTTIDGIKLDKSGVLKEFPDLNGDEDWRKKAVERFKKHIHNLRNETERNDYVIKELTKFGYKGLMTQKAGFRPKRIK